MVKRGEVGWRSVDELLKDPEWVKQRVEGRAERERQFAQFVESLGRDQETLVEELRAAGVEVSSVWDLVNTEAPYPSAIPVLANHLSKPHHPRIREGIVRALAVPEAHRLWRQLLDAFREEQDEGMKLALAIAVGNASGPEDTEQLRVLVHDEGLGMNRVPLIWGLAKSRDPKAAEVLAELRDHPELGAEARKGLRKRKRLLNL